MLVRTGTKLNLSEAPAEKQENDQHSWNEEVQAILKEAFPDYDFDSDTLEKPTNRGFLVFLALSSDNQRITELDLSYNGISFLKNEENDYGARDSVIEIDAPALAEQPVALEIENTQESTQTKFEETTQVLDSKKSAAQKRRSSESSLSTATPPPPESLVSTPGQLKKLILRGNSFDKASIANIMQKIAGSALEELDLSDCHLNEECALVVADQLEHIKQLRILNIKNNDGFYYPEVLQSLALSLTKFDAMQSVTFTFNTLSFSIKQLVSHHPTGAPPKITEGINELKEKAEIALEASRTEYKFELNKALERIAALKLYKNFQYEANETTKFVLNIDGDTRVTHSIMNSINKFMRALENNAEAYTLLRKNFEYDSGQSSLGQEKPENTSAVGSSHFSKFKITTNAPDDNTDGDKNPRKRNKPSKSK